jgi:hypothetical protein
VRERPAGTPALGVRWVVTTRYDEAVRELYQAPHPAFVAERKRLAAELKAAGDKPGATQLGKLPRPPISAWAVNQLWWQEREAFDRLLATAARLRDGDLGANAPHREALTALRVRASTILGDAGHAGTEATLRRIATTLSAIAASGGFEPDPPGALSADRDPPGFEAAGIPGLAASAAASNSDATAAAPDDHATRAEAARQHAAAEDATAKAAAAAEAEARRRREEAAARKLAERHRLEAALRTARGEVERRERELGRLERAVAEARTALDKSRVIADDLEAKLAELPD